MNEDNTHQPPTDRATILERANHARVMFDEGQRKFTVKALCRDRFRSGPMYDGPTTDLPDDEIIEAAYGPGGAGIYWRAWLFGAAGRAELVQVMAAHCAVDQDSYHRIWRKLLSALDRAPAGSDMQADVRWLVDNPNTRCFVPSSLTALVVAVGASDIPPDQGEITRTGAPGRPSSMSLIVAEWQSRVARQQALPLKKDEAAALRTWLERTHPSALLPSEKAIRNRLSKPD